MRTIGVKVFGIRLPVINTGDDLSQLITDQISLIRKTENISLNQSDIIGVT